MRTAHIFFDTGGRLENIFIFSHSPRENLASRVYDQVIHDGHRSEGLRPYLADAIRRRNPRRVGLNMSPTLPMADELTTSLKSYLDEAIGPDVAVREVSAELLEGDFRARRTERESRLPTARRVDGCLGRGRPDPRRDQGRTHHTRRRALVVARAGACDRRGHRILSAGAEDHARRSDVEANDPNTPIAPRDYLSIDAGLQFIQFQTDMKRSAYVLRPGETPPAAGVRNALAAASAVIDPLIANMVPGRLGHQVWDMTMTELNALGYVTAYAMGSSAGLLTPEVGI